MLPPPLFAVAGLVLLLAGGELLVRGSVGLALRLGLAPLAIGLTVVAFATSSPEMAVSVEAALTGHGNVGLGNVLGSNLMNVLLIAGAASLAAPLPFAGLEPADVWSVLALSVALWLAAALHPRLGRTAGAGLLAAYLLYLGWRLASG